MNSFHSTVSNMQKKPQKYDSHESTGIKSAKYPREIFRILPDIGYRILVSGITLHYCDEYRVYDISLATNYTYRSNNKTVLLLLCFAPMLY